MIEVRVIPTRTLFPQTEDNFGIYGAEVHDDDRHLVEINNYGNISFKGITPALSMGEEYIARLRKDADSKFKGSYIVESIRQEKPVTVEGQKQFFKMILSDTQLNNIYDVYEGQDIIQMIVDDTFDYKHVKGIAEKTYEKMREKVLTNLEMSELLIFLAEHGIRFNMVQKLIKHYKNPQIVIQKIEENPYVLTEVKGVGFQKADAIAKAMGFDMKSPHRIDACVNYIISEENANGHSWIDKKQLLNRAIDYLNIKYDLIEARLDGPIDFVLNAGGRFTRRRVIEAEAFVAQSMIRLKTQCDKVFETEFVEQFLNEYCEKHGVELEENQRQFFHDWNENGVLMLIGSGGMGKSWLMRILLDLVDTKHLITALLSPTGRASKVLAQHTGRPASTIHRKAGVFDEDMEQSNSIDEDVVIIDEASMCDVFILEKFFKALSNPNTRVLFVGDDFQLPSVGVGNFLYDVIHSECIKVSRLKKVFRQATGGILNVSTDVREGKKFLNPTADGRIVFGKDCVFWMTDQEFVADGVLTNYERVLEKYRQEDILILSPTNKGRLGTIALNREIQKIANPPSPRKKEKAVGKKDNPTYYRVGDMVMNLVNTYGMETVTEGVADIFNGDTGRIIDIDEAEKVFIIDFDGIHVKMKFGVIMNNLTHAWVMTIHKAQGSQYPLVIAIADKSMKFQLNANLLYTGFSRAQSYMLVLGQAETINHGMEKFANMERRSFMKELLVKANGMDLNGSSGQVQ
jgi:RecD/TraA family predicted helicase